MQLQIVSSYIPSIHSQIKAVHDESKIADFPQAYNVIEPTSEEKHDSTLSTPRPVNPQYSNPSFLILSENISAPHKKPAGQTIRASGLIKFWRRHVERKIQHLTIHPLYPFKLHYPNISTRRMQLNL